MTLTTCASMPVLISDFAVCHGMSHNDFSRSCGWVHLFGNLRALYAKIFGAPLASKLLLLNERSTLTMCGAAPCCAGRLDEVLLTATQLHGQDFCAGTIMQRDCGHHTPSSVTWQDLFPSQLGPAICPKAEYDLDNLWRRATARTQEAGHPSCGAWQRRVRDAGPGTSLQEGRADGNPEH